MVKYLSLAQILNLKCKFMQTYVRISKHGVLEFTCLRGQYLCTDNERKLALPARALELQYCMSTDIGALALDGFLLQLHSVDDHPNCSSLHGRQAVQRVLEQRAGEAGCTMLEQRAFRKKMSLALSLLYPNGKAMWPRQVASEVDADGALSLLRQPATENI